VLRACGVEPPQGTRLGGFLLVAVVVGVLYALVVDRSRFGFELRATGPEPLGRRRSGVDAKRMTLVTMLLSGAVAGLVGLPQLLGTSYSYGLDFSPARVHRHRGGPARPRIAVGIAFAALLFAFLERSSATLQRIDVPTEIYVIMQGSIVLSVVVAYEAVRRIGVAQAERPCGASPSRWPRDDRPPRRRAAPRSSRRRPTPTGPARGTAPAHACCLGRPRPARPAVRRAGGVRRRGRDEQRHVRRGAAPRRADRAGRLGRPVGRARGRREHRPRGHAHPRHLVGAWAGFFYGPWWASSAAIAAGALGGLLHAVATVTFGVDHVVSGVAVNLLGAGIARYLSSIAYGGDDAPAGSGQTQSPTTRGLPDVSLPVLSSGPDLLGDLERQRWFLLSDAAGVLRGLTAGVSLITLLAVLLVPLSFYVLWRTPFGLRLRAVGENPVAADSLGVAVYRMKYAAVVVSGALAGLGGAALVIGSIYREGQTAGRGFIGLAAVIFGNWRPGGLAAGASLFGYADAVQLRAGSAVRALLLLVALPADRRRGVPGARAPHPGRARVGPARRCVLPLVRHGRHGAVAARRLHAAPRDAPRAGRRVATAATARGRRRALPARAADVTGPRVQPDWDDLRAKAVEAAARAYAPVLGAAGRRRGADGRPAAARPATSRTPRTASRCAPSAGSSRSCTPPEEGCSPRSRAGRARATCSCRAAAAGSCCGSTAAPSLLVDSPARRRADDRGAAGRVRRAGLPASGSARP
jgi:ABC-type uncharacterized transport system permease subunit